MTRRSKVVLTLENEGSTKVAIGTISIDGTYGSASQFSFRLYCGADISPGKICTVAVSFDPDALGMGFGLEVTGMAVSELTSTPVSNKYVLKFCA